MIDALIVGGGPAGLMAAQQLHESGARVLITDAKPSLARKFLMAGKSGLNLTKNESLDRFLTQYGAAHWLHPALRDFGPEQVRDWAQALGQPVFTGSSGRVFPVAMKGSPLLRAWLSVMPRLQVATRWRWTGLQDGASCFDTPDGPRQVKPRVTILAMGGASWARLGSDGAWAQRLDVPLAPFQPSNMGFLVAWSSHMVAHFGQPVKNIALRAGGDWQRGEIVVTEQGLEGGGLYPLSARLRDGARLEIDFLPDLTVDEVQHRLSMRPKTESLTNRLRKAFGLSGVRLALLRDCLHPLPLDLALALKACPVPLGPPQPMDRAISTAGGIRAEAFDETLMLRQYPGVFVAGEMLDWDAPTGGYLLTACLATGRWAGGAAVNWLERGRQQKSTGAAP
jgi:uncharacterized flavoprotein (TIGR03862 family)